MARLGQLLLVALAILAVSTMLILAVRAIAMDASRPDRWEVACTTAGGHEYTGTRGRLCLTTDGRVIEP